jgi:hypothetical protein
MGSTDAAGSCAGISITLELNGRRIKHLRLCSVAQTVHSFPRWIGSDRSSVLINLVVPASTTIPLYRYFRAVVCNLEHYS